jgi:hypothetical protein
MIARRAELAGAEAVAEDGGAEPGALAAGTAGAAADAGGDSIGAGARAVATSAAARAASAVRLWRVSPRAGAAPLVASELERAASASPDGVGAFAPPARPERSGAAAGTPAEGVVRPAGGVVGDGRPWRVLRALSSTLAGAALSLAFGRGMAPLAPGAALELAVDAGRALPVPGRRVLGRVGAKGWSGGSGGWLVLERSGLLDGRVPVAG